MGYTFPSTTAGGSISLSNIQTFCGGSNPISLNEYYAGGSYVPAGTVGTYGSVPSSGAISVRDFYGVINTLTTGQDTNYFAGGKGVPYYTLITSGFTAGSGTYGNYVDYGAYFSVTYNSIGSFFGKVLIGGTDYSVLELKHFRFTCETPVEESKLIIRIAGNVSGTYTPYIDGSAIAGSKTGSYDGTNTTFTWLKGTQNNGSAIPGQDTSTPTSNPFGNSGTAHRFTMV